MKSKVVFLSFCTRPPKSKYKVIDLFAGVCFIRSLYHGNVTDHDDTIVRRVVRPGVTAVHLRLHPARFPEPSVWKKMSTAFVFVMKIGGRKYHE